MKVPLLISIHPEFIEKILKGEKVFEFRKSLPSQLPTHLVIYATTPVQKVVAVVDVEGVLSGAPSRIWRQAGKGGGISRSYFRQYFAGRKSAQAIQLGLVFKMKQPLCLESINSNLVAPQSYRFLGNADFTWIQAQIEEGSVHPRCVIFLGGVHGVGKSSLCQREFSPMGYTCATASSIIRAAGGTVVNEKTVKNVSGNQDALIRSLPSVLKKYARFVLDGHFTLVNAECHIEPIPLEVFRRINPNILILLTGEPSEIALRLKSRDKRKWSELFVAEFQNAEIEHAKKIAKALNIPLHIVRNDENPSIILSLIKQERSR